MNLLPRGPVTRRRVSNHSKDALTVTDSPTPSPTMLSAGGEWYGHHQLQQHTAGAGQALISASQCLTTTL